MADFYGTGRSVKVCCRYNEEAEVHKVLTYNLVQFAEWYQRAKARGAKIIPNGMTGMIVITDNRYFDVEVI